MYSLIQRHELSVTQDLKAISITIREMSHATYNLKAQYNNFFLLFILILKYMITKRKNCSVINMSRVATNLCPVPNDRSPGMAKFILTGSLVIMSE